MGLFGSQNQKDWIQIVVILNRVDIGYLDLIKASYFQRDRIGPDQNFRVSNLLGLQPKLQREWVKKMDALMNFFT